MQISRTTRQRLDLLWLLVAKEVTFRYKRTYLGFLWTLMNPLLTALVFFVAFTIFMRFEIEYFAFFLLAALFPWIWFSASLSIATGTLTSNASLIRKVVFPKHLLILSVVIAQMVNFVLTLPILLGLALHYNIPPTLNWLIGIPILALVQFVIIYGLGLMVSVANVYFRDLEYIVTVVIGLLFWMTPIIYPLSAVPEGVRHWLTLNPMSYPIQAWRDLFLHNTLNWPYIGVGLATAVVVLLLGQWLFRRMSSRLDEVL